MLSCFQNCLLVSSTPAMEDVNEDSSLGKDENYSFQQKTLFISSYHLKSDAAVLQRPILDHTDHVLPKIRHNEKPVTDPASHTSNEIHENLVSKMTHTRETETATFFPHPPSTSSKLRKRSRTNPKETHNLTDNYKKFEEDNKSETSAENSESKISYEKENKISDVLPNDLNDDSLLINSYENFLRDLTKEENVSSEDSDSKIDDKSMSESLSTDFSVSSLSDSDGETSDNTTEEDAGLKCKKIEAVDPLYSLPMKSRKNDNSLKDSSTIIKDGDLLKSSKLSHYVELVSCSDNLRTMSAPDLRDSSGFRTLDTRGYMCPRFIPQVESSERATLSSPELKKTSFSIKYRPLPSIPFESYESKDDENETIYERIRTRDLSQTSQSPTKSNKMSFKDVANRVVSLMPRLTTREARSREIDQHMADIARYLPDRKLRIFVGTWNMKGIKDLPRSLDDYLLPSESVFIQDIYAVGCQEGTPFRKEWEICLQETLGPTHVLMYSANFGVLQLSIFVRRELVWFCTGIEQDTVATRIAHKIKTKGAIAVSFNVFGTSLLFINSHFASDQEKLRERVKDYKTIIHSLSIPFGSNDNADRNNDVTSRFDRVFWFGDFNFRVNKTRSETDEVFAERSFNDRHERKRFIIDNLLPYDQLTTLMKKGKIFHGFQESTIRFLPTYKFDVNSDSFDTSAKKRVPSWTDRILYKSRHPDFIKVSMYNSCNAIKCSDHRPVYAVLEAEIEPIKKNALLPSAMFDRDIYVEAHMRRSAPTGNQHSSNVCVIL